MRTGAEGRVNKGRFTNKTILLRWDCYSAASSAAGCDGASSTAASAAAAAAGASAAAAGGAAAAAGAAAAGASPASPPAPAPVPPLNLPDATSSYLPRAPNTFAKQGLQKFFPSSCAHFASVMWDLHSSQLKHVACHTLPSAVLRGNGGARGVVRGSCRGAAIFHGKGTNTLGSAAYTDFVHAAHFEPPPNCAMILRGRVVVHTHTYRSFKLKPEDFLLAPTAVNY